MEIPQTPLLKYFRNGKGSILLNGRLYCLIRDESRENNLVWYDSKYGLEERMTLSDLESDYFDESEEQINKFCNELLQTEGVKVNRELEKQKDILHLKDNYYFIKVIMNKIVPNFNPDLKIANLEKNREINGTELELKASEDFSEIKRKYDFNIIKDILKSNFFIVDGKFYPLFKEGKIPINKKRYLFKGKNCYNIGDCTTIVEELETAYKNCISKRLQDIIIKGNDSLFKKIEEIYKDKNCIDILNEEERFWSLKSNPAKKIGFINKEKGFYIAYPVMDSFILHDPKINSDKNYFGYGASFNLSPLVIGVKIKKEGNSINIGEPVIINKTAHPSVNCVDRWSNSKKHNGTSYFKICNGFYTYKNVKETKLENKIMHLISTGTKLIQNYSASGKEWAPFFKCYEFYKNYDGIYVKILDKNQAEKSKVPIVNLDILKLMERNGR